MHGLRAAGLERGDAFAVVLPNGPEFFTAYLAATQAGFYLVPVNHHLVGPEIAWIVADSGAKVLLAHERFAGPAGTPPTRPASRPPTGTPSARSRASGRTPNSSTDNRSHRPPTAPSAGS